MSDWQPKHEIMWVALGNDKHNTLIGVADTYELVSQLGIHWSKQTGETRYLREYSERTEVRQPTMPDVVEIDGNYYRKELSYDISRE